MGRSTTSARPPPRLETTPPPNFRRTLKVGGPLLHFGSVGSVFASPCLKWTQFRYLFGLLAVQGNRSSHSWLSSHASVLATNHVSLQNFVFDATNPVHLNTVSYRSCNITKIRVQPKACTSCARALSSLDRKSIGSSIHSKSTYPCVRFRTQTINVCAL